MESTVGVGNGPSYQLALRAVDTLSIFGPGPHTRHGAAGLTAAWLLEVDQDTRVAYFRDLARWVGWCHRKHLDTTDVRPTDVGEYRVLIGQRLAPASVARAMAAASSWYRYLVANTAPGYTRNPFAGIRRPRIDRDTTVTVGLEIDEVAALLDAAGRAGGRARLRNLALIHLLAATGLRAGEARNLDTADLGYERGYRTITFTAKGGLTRVRPIDTPVAGDIDAYLADRVRRGLPRDGPVFATERRGELGRLDHAETFRIVRRLAGDAGLLAADRISPHSLRHFFATDALGPGGKALHEVQDAMGHADPRTTRRYDRARHSLSGDATLVVSRRIAERRGDTP